MKAESGSEVVTDLRGRLERAVDDLASLHNGETDPLEKHRLFGKVQGVHLALDYLRAYEPAGAALRGGGATNG